MRFNILFLVLILGLCYNASGQDNSGGSDNSGSLEGSNQDVNGNDDNNSEVNENNSQANESNDNQTNDNEANGSGDEEWNDNEATNNITESTGNENGTDDSGDYKYYYPCAVPSDINCVRAFFLSSLQCVLERFDDRQPVYRKRHVAHLPQVNASIYSSGDVITFENSHIDDMYINPKTNNLVLTVTFGAIKIETRHARFVIYQKGKEPIIKGDAVNMTFTPTLTGVIPVGDFLDLERALVSAYNYDAKPPIQMGPYLAQNSDPVVAQTMDALYANFPTIVQELFLTQSYSLFIAYVQTHICYFGIPFSTIRLEV